MPRDCSIPSKGITFTSNLSDVEAIQLVRKTNPRAGSFAHSLLGQYDAKRPYSNVQWSWVHKMALDNQPKPQEQSTPTGPAISLPRIIQLFNAAREHIKRPEMKFELKTTDDFEFPLRINSAAAGRFPGCVHVGQGKPGLPYYGRINADGTFEPGKDANRPEFKLVMELLNCMNLDPAKAAAEYGRRTGRCCFCGMYLTDDRSVGVGYGPVCAKNYGLKEEWKAGADLLPPLPTEIDLPVQPNI